MYLIHWLFPLFPHTHTHTHTHKHTHSNKQTHSLSLSCSLVTLVGSLLGPKAIFAKRGRHAKLSFKGKKRVSVCESMCTCVCEWVCVCVCLSACVSTCVYAWEKKERERERGRKMDLKSSRTYQQLINFLARLELTLATAFAFPSLSSSNIFCEKKLSFKTTCLRWKS